MEKRPETPAEWYERSREKVRFVRREIVRLDTDLDRQLQELWASGKLLQWCAVNGVWPRNDRACHSFYGECQYFDLCWGGWQDGDPLPVEYVQDSDPMQQELT